MSSSRSDIEPAPGLQLEPRAPIKRPLSAIEYYHASVGRSGRAKETTRELIYVVEGDGPEFAPTVWREALARASAANPGSRLRMVGRRWRAQWTDDGPPPRLRIVDRTDWDAMSGAGAGFINAEPISLERGPTVELILVNHSPRGRLVILRTLHAIMDGRGGLHFLRELFRALRGAPLCGSNAGFSDVDLMRRLSPKKSISRHVRTEWLTGMPQGDEPGDEWRRVALETSSQNILARSAGIMAEYFHQHSSRPALFAVPVDLRRRLAGLASTTNFSSMLMVQLDKGEGPDAFRQKLGVMIEGRMDLYWFSVLGLVKLFSFFRLDRFLSATKANNHPKRVMETAVISNLGAVDFNDFSCDDFRASRLFMVPLVTNCVYVMLVGSGDRIELGLGMPKVLASNGRFDDLIAFLRRRLPETESGQPQL